MAHDTTSPELNDVTADAGFRLSPTQLDLWRRQAQAQRVFLTQFVWHVDAALTVAEVTTALLQICQRHELLRTTVKTPAGLSLPLQFVAPFAQPEVAAEDCSAVLAADLPGKAESLLAAQRAKFTCPQRSADWGLVVVSTAQDETFLLGTFPTLLADAACGQVLLAELASACAGAADLEGAAGLVPDEPLQFADLAEWQNGLLEEPESSSGREFWQANVPLTAHLELPLERSTPAGVTAELQSISVPLDAQLSQKLNDLANSRDLPPETLLLTLWRILLRRWTGVETCTIGVTTAGRDYEGLSLALGALARDLPAAGTIHLAEPLLTAAQREQQVAEERRGWQDDFAWSQFADSRRRAAGDAYFTVGFAAEAVTEAVTVGTRTWKLLAARSCAEQYKLRLAAQQSAAGWQFGLEYDPGCFDRPTAERFANQLATLLQDATTHPNATVAELAILPAAEQALVKTLLRGAPLQTPPAGTLPDWITAQALRTPQAAAVESASGSLSYAELDSQATQLALHLRALGVGSETLVGLCVPRCAEMLVGIFGILKAGAAYVPLDPLYPPDRLAFILEDTATPVVVTLSGTKSLLPESSARLVCLDQLLGERLDSAKQQLPAISPVGCAYVIYTSGSTGKPKGVEITHANLAHSTAARLQYYGLTPQRYLLLSSFAFDSSVAGIFWTLATGGTLVLPEDGAERDPAAVAALITERRITTLLALPALYRIVLQQASATELAALQNVIVAGDVCPAPLVSEHCGKLKQTRLYNEYGPTEGTVWATVFHAQQSGTAARVPIGSAVPGMQLYLLDELRRPVPLGVAGECYLAGPGVARGYLRRPEITAERFLPDPFSSDPTGRLYRTGDLARCLPDGNVEFLGRVDHQVKIRGYRIELGEIEQLLSAHPQIQEAAVVALAGGTEAVADELRLVAYVLPGQTAPEVAALRDYLNDRLPTYMVPAQIILLKDFPRTPTGKVDRKALPDPGQATSSRSYVAPRSPLEQVLAGIWAQVLRVERVGAEDHFFELGGHSLLVTQLVSRLRESLQIEIPLRRIFEKPQLAELATSILANEEERQRIEKTAELLVQLSSMSEEDVARMLQAEA